jgi:hypothetical protein
MSVKDIFNHWTEKYPVSKRGFIKQDGECQKKKYLSDSVL